MTGTVLDGNGEQIPGRRTLEGTDLVIAYTLLGEDLVLRVSKSGVQVLAVVLENAAKAMTAQQMLELKSESADLLVDTLWAAGRFFKVPPWKGFQPRICRGAALRAAYRGGRGRAARTHRRRQH